MTPCTHSVTSTFTDTPNPNNWTTFELIDSDIKIHRQSQQWVDGSSARVIEFALRRLSERIGVLAAMRADKRAEAGVSVQLRGPGGVPQVPVGPLSLGDLHEMLRVRLAGDHFPGLCSAGSSMFPRGIRSTPLNTQMSFLTHPRPARRRSHRGGAHRVDPVAQRALADTQVPGHLRDRLPLSRTSRTAPSRKS